MLKCVYWNVRGSIDRCLASYEGTHHVDDVKIFAFGETHLTDAKQLAYKFPKPGFKASYATRADGNGGVAVFVHESLDAKVLHMRMDPDLVFVSVGEQDTSLVMLYAKPARPGSHEDLFDILEQELSRAPQHACTLLIGDLNARVGLRNRELEQHAGAAPVELLARGASAGGGPVRIRRSMDARTCGRGRRCIQFCDTHQFDVANGCAPGTNNHAFTFHSLGHLGRSVVDLCLINAACFENLRELSIAEEPIDRCTDHSCMTIAVEVHMRTQALSSQKSPKLIWDARTWGRYASEVRARQGRIQEMTRTAEGTDTESVDSLVQRMLRFLANLTFRAFRQQTTVDTVGSRRHGLVWFDDECRQAREAIRLERARYALSQLPAHASTHLRMLTNRYQAMLKRKKLQAKAKDAADLVKLARSDARAFWAWLHNREHNLVPIDIACMHDHFCNVYEATSVPCARLLGQGLGSRDGEHDTHITHNMNMPATQHVGDHAPRRRGDALNSPITQGEVVRALKMLKNGRASGDGYIGELLKYAKVYDEDTKTYVFDLAPFCTAILNRIFMGMSSMGRHMRMCKLAVIYKGRGQVGDSDSYRGIAVGSAMYKLYATVLNNRLDAYCENMKLRAITQCGFRKNHSTCTALFILQHSIHSQCASRPGHNTGPLYVCFIDFRKAFDSVHIPHLWHRLQDLGVSGRMLQAIQNIYQHTPMRLQLNGVRHSQAMLTTKGVKQGCPMSPLLFGIFIELLHQSIDTNCRDLSGVHISGHNILDIIYADDMALMSKQLDHMNQLCATLGDFCRDKDMEVNVPKSNYVVFRSHRDTTQWPRGVAYGGQDLQEVEEFRYMGLPVHCRRWLRDSLKHTATLASRAMWALIRKLRRSDTMPIHIKLQLFHSVVGAIAGYGCQVWGVYHLDWRSEHRIFTTNPLQKLVLQFLRVITGAHSHTSRWVLLRECNLLPVQVGWAKACAKWWHNTLSRGGEDLARLTLWQDIDLFRAGLKQGWTGLFLKCMASLDLCEPLDSLRMQDREAIAGLTFTEERIEQAYTERYSNLYWDMHCMEPRGRSGRHAAFIKHRCWFHTEVNPALKLNAWDTQVQALMKFRLGTHTLRCNEHALPMRQRLCRLCDDQVVEDEVHVVFECNAYATLRARQRWMSLYTGQVQNDLNAFMNQENQFLLSAFINALLNFRRSKLRTLEHDIDIVDPELP